MMVARFLRVAAGSRLGTGLVSGAVVAAVVVGGQAAWAAASSPSVTYTGCLGSSSGSVYNAKKGASPLGKCTAGDKKIVLSGGDITAVAAGTGLTGGTTSGPASLALASTYQLPQGCSAGSSPVEGSGTWVCGIGASSEFDFQSVGGGGFETVQLGRAELILSCASGAGEIEAEDETGGGGSFNIFGVLNGSATAFQHGYSIPPFGDLDVADNAGSTASYIWTGASGDVVTGTINWFYHSDSSTCEFEGDTIHPQS